MRYVGIDWATDVHFVALLDESGDIVDEWRVRHDPSEVAGLVERLEAEGGPATVVVAVEAGAPLVTDVLLDAGFCVYALNPKQADRFRDRHTSAGAKDDRRDALVLADAIRTDSGRMRPIERDSALTEEMRLRDRARTRLVGQRTRFANQLRQVLGRYHPALLAFGRAMHDRFLLALLRAYPVPDAAQGARTPKLERLLREHRIRVLDVEQLRSVLRGPAFPVPGHVAEACRDEALDLADQIELLNGQIDRAEARLRDLFERHPDREILKSLPGLGDWLAIRVAAELGDNRARRCDPTTLQAFAGTAPVTRRSGKRGIIGISMRKGCNRVLQSALFQMARCSVHRSAWAANYLRHLRGRGVPLRKAIRALSNKWAKILATVLATRTSYDEDLHVANLARNGVPWVDAPQTTLKIPA